MALACIEALFALSGQHAPPELLVELSGRGGASGIGINTYFSGGFVLDVGRRGDASKFHSSESISTPFVCPAPLVKLAMPNWSIGIVYPPAALHTSAQQESDIFRRLPLPIDEVYKTAYHSVFGICAAVLADDFENFCVATRAVQECAWKRMEVDAHGAGLKHIVESLYRLGADCVGMSSMGPGLYFLARNFDAVFERARVELSEMELIRTTACNTGRSINYD